MEIKVSISAVINIQDGEVNVNEILYEAGRFGDVLKKQMAEKMIESYQEAMAGKMCDRKEGWVVEHTKKGTDHEVCRGKLYIRHGYRRDSREIKADFGTISFRVQNVKCKGCGRIFAPITKVLKIGDWERKTEGLTMKIADLICKQSDGYGVGSLGDISGVKIPKSTAHRWIVGEDWKDLETGRRGEQIDFVLVDGTGFRRQIPGGGKGDIRYVIGLTDKGEKRVLGIWANRSWEEIGQEVEADLKGQEKKPWTLTSDGEPGIGENLGEIARFHQRCTWHEKRDLGYALWRDGMERDERESHIERLSGIIGIQLPQGEYESIREEDKKGIRKRLDSCKGEFHELIREFEENGYKKAATYLKNSVGNIFSYVELWLEVGVTSPRTTSMLESIIRQVGRRTKKIGASWSDDGLEKVVKLFLKKTYESSGWEQYWKKRMGIKNGYKITLLSVDFEVMAT